MHFKDNNEFKFTYLTKNNQQNITIYNMKLQR